MGMRKWLWVDGHLGAKEKLWGNVSTRSIDENLVQARVDGPWSLYTVEASAFARAPRRAKRIPARVSR